MIFISFRGIIKIMLLFRISFGMKWFKRTVNELPNIFWGNIIGGGIWCLTQWNGPVTLSEYVLGVLIETILLRALVSNFHLHVLLLKPRTVDGVTFSTFVPLVVTFLLKLLLG